MKFPLPVRPFDHVKVAEQDAQTIETLANLFVEQTLEQYEDHLENNHGIVDPTKWKLLMKREKVTIYQERLSKNTIGNRNRSRGGSSSMPLQPGSEDAEKIPKKMQRIMSFGTIDGKLHDVMYGVVNPTAESMMIKTSYVGDNVSDCTVLATIIAPTVEDPFRSLLLKWSINSGPVLVRDVMRPLVRSRDFCYLESTGITHNRKGERLGFHIIHSVEVPEIRQLHEFKLVRGNFSLYHIYRQKNPDTVEVYFRGYMDLLGDLPATIATYACADGSIALWRNVYCAEHKKLTWMLDKGRKHSQYTHGECSVCHKSISEPPKHSCRVCIGGVCRRCHVKKKLSFLSPLSRVVIQKYITFCTACVHVAVQTSGFEVAKDELRRQKPYHVYEDALVRSTSSGDTVPSCD